MPRNRATKTPTWIPKSCLHLVVVVVAPLDIQGRTAGPAVARAHDALEMMIGPSPPAGSLLRNASAAC